MFYLSKLKQNNTCLLNSAHRLLLHRLFFFPQMVIIQKRVAFNSENSARFSFKILLCKRKINSAKISHLADCENNPVKSGKKKSHVIHQFCSRYYI